MSLPKSYRILQAVKARAAVIRKDAGYLTDIGQTIFLDSREPNISEMPCLMIFRSARTVSESKGQRQSCAMPISIIGYASLGGLDAEAIGANILADIQRAMEIEDADLDRLLLGSQGGLVFQGDDTIVPDSGVDAVAGEVQYDAPHIRKRGDPEIE